MVPGYYRAHNFGAGASAALGGWVLSADGGLKLTENADGTRIDIKRPEILYAVQADRAVSIGRQPFNVSAGLYHRLILHADAELKSEYSPLVENVVAALRDFYLLQEEPSTVYVVGRLDTSLFRETLNLGVIRRLGDHRRGAPPGAARRAAAERLRLSRRRRQSLVFVDPGRRLGPVGPRRRQGQRVRAARRALLNHIHVGGARHVFAGRQRGPSRPGRLSSV